MPIYCYKCPSCGDTKEVQKPMAKCDSLELCDVDGFAMKRSVQAEHGKTRHNPGNWPMTSYAAGVAVNEVPYYTKFDRENGVPTSYDSEGDPVFTDRKHRKKYCQLHKVFDRNAGDGDPTPVNM